MNNREKIINALEKAKKQSEEFAQDIIIVPFKETDMIIALLKEQEAEIRQLRLALDIAKGTCKGIVMEGR